MNNEKPLTLEEEVIKLRAENEMFEREATADERELDVVWGKTISLIEQLTNERNETKEKLELFTSRFDTAIKGLRLMIEDRDSLYSSNALFRKTLEMIADYDSAMSDQAEYLSGLAKKALEAQKNKDDAEFEAHKDRIEPK